MTLTTRILLTYRTPLAALSDWTGAERREIRSVLMIFGACFFLALSALPFAVEQNPQVPLDMRIGAVIFFWLAMMPLVLYLLFLAISNLMARISGGSSEDLRVALCWALFASGPLFLLNGAAFAMFGQASALVVGLPVLVLYLVITWRCVASVRS